MRVKDKILSLLLAILITVVLREQVFSTTL